MATILSFMNNKGGVGKTATTAVMAELLVSLGNKVLIVDMDEQSNISMIFHRYGTGLHNIKTIFLEKLRTREDVKKCIQTTDIKGIDIISSCLEHANTQTILSCDKTCNINIILKKALDTVKEDYDYILIDNAPANNSLSVNSIIASDLIYIPAKAESLSFEGARNTIDTILKVKDEFMVSNVKFGGTFLVGVDIRTNNFKERLLEFKNTFGSSCMTSFIRKSVRIQEMESIYEPLLFSKKNTSEILYDYGKLLYEFNLLPADQQSMLKENFKF